MTGAEIAAKRIRGERNKIVHILNIMREAWGEPREPGAGKAKSHEALSLMDDAVEALTRAANLTTALPVRVGRVEWDKAVRKMCVNRRGPR